MPLTLICALCCVIQATAVAVKKEYIIDTKDLEEYRHRVALSLKEFEVELCEHLENMSKMSLNSIKKKFISLDLSSSDGNKESISVI
jgi:hypothetical protein